MRVKKVQKPCPVCKHNIADVVETPRVNKDMETLIETLQQRAREEDEQRAEAKAADLDGEEDAEGTENKSAANVGGSGAGGSKPSPAKAAPVPSPPRPRLPPVQSVEKYASQIEMLREEFPCIDVSMIKCFLEDQEGDVKDVRYTLRVLQQQQEKEARASKRQKT